MKKNPKLYQINTRVWLNQISTKIGYPATFDDIGDDYLDELANLGFDWIYLLSVWQIGDAGRQVSRTNSQWQQEFRELLPDLQDEDICGSGFAITSYNLNSKLGDFEALIRLRNRLHQRGLKLMLDFVPNHTALDHPWVQDHPDYYISGTAAQLNQQPQNYFKTSQGESILAYGRDPYFDGWPDTLQLNYGNPNLQNALIEELLKISQWCDGLRCDMAMLVLPEIFDRTWGITAEPFWPKAIPKIRQFHPDFTFMAEVYWDLEWTLQQQGFDYTYDKRLYDRLLKREADSVRSHFWADLDYQTSSARFLENHDEPRAASTFEQDIHRAAAVLTYFCPGLRFFHQGQLQGWKQKISVHLCRAPEQATDRNLHEFYARLLEVLRLQIFQLGSWQILNCKPAWDENRTFESLIVFAWQDNGFDQDDGEDERCDKDKQRVIVVVNYAPNHSQCYVELPSSYFKKSYPNESNFNEKLFELKDLMGSARYIRHGAGLVSPGLYLDLPPWGFHVFELSKAN